MVIHPVDKLWLRIETPASLGVKIVEDWQVRLEHDQVRFIDGWLALKPKVNVMGQVHMVDKCAFAKKRRVELVAEVGIIWCGRRSIDHDDIG